MSTCKNALRRVFGNVVNVLPTKCLLTFNYLALLQFLFLASHRINLSLCVRCMRVCYVYILMVCLLFEFSIIFVCKVTRSNIKHCYSYTMSIQSIDFPIYIVRLTLFAYFFNIISLFPSPISLSLSLFF